MSVRIEVRYEGELHTRAAHGPSGATLETDAGQQVTKAGTCIGFPAGTGDAHRFLNKTDKDVVFLVVGDRTKGDEVVYPDVDLAGRPGPDGKYIFTKKDGSSY